jgi:outer membrane receptor for ferric coprogen and ferric-rhodotorulic acid
VRIFRTRRADSQRLGGAIASALLATTGLTTGLAIMPAPAQAQTVRSYDIPAGPLATALNRFVEASGVALVYDSALTNGLSSPGLKGSFGTAEALSRLLAGSGLTFRQTGPNSFTLERATQSADGAIQLGPVRVEGQNSTASTISDPGATEDSGSYAGSVTSSATGLNLTARETPQSITVVTRQQIEDQNLTDLGEVLSQVPGVNIVRLDSERASFTARGEADLNIMIDGRPANDYWNQTSNELTRAARFNTAIYDRVEVVRGSTGLTNGVGNFGGTVNLVRKRPIAGVFTPKFMLGGGSWGYVQGMADASFDLARDGGIRARSVAYVQRDGSNIDAYQKFQGVFYGIAEADLGENAVLGIGVEHDFIDVRGQSFAHIPTFYDDGTIFYTPRSYNPGSRQARDNEHGTTVFSDLTWKVADDWSLKLYGSYWDASGHLYRSGIQPFYRAVGKSDGSIDAFRADVTQDAQRYTLDGKFEGSFEAFGRRHDLLVGVTWDKTRTDDFDTFYFAPIEVNALEWDNNLPIGTREDDPFDQRQAYRFEQISAYVTARLRLADPLAVIVGTRYVDYKTSSLYVDFGGGTSDTVAFSAKNRFIPYAGALLDLTKNITLYASYTDIFQPQNVRDINGNILPPLTGVTYEAGLKGEFFNGRLQPAASVFRREEKNLAVEVPGGIVPGSPFEQAYAAARGVVTQGFEITLAGEPLPGWTLQGGYSYFHISGADEIEFGIQHNLPRQTFKLATSVALTDRFKLGGNFYWQEGVSYSTNYYGGQEEIFTANLDGYAIADIFAKYKVADKFNVSVNVDNLFDKKYIETLSPYNSYVWGRPRRFLVTLRYGLN